MESLLDGPELRKNAVVKKAIAFASIIGSLTFSAFAEKVVTYAGKGSPHSLDPMTMYDVPTYSFGINIYESLVTRDAKMDLVPCLATEWKNTSPDTWRFSLRQGVQFHDGSPFTAQDVVFSLERAKGKGSDIAGALASIKEIKVIDQFTIDVVTHEQNPILPAEIYSLPIFSKIWCEKHNAQTVPDVTKKEDGYADRHANGTGPFKVESYQSEVQITVIRNTEWWKKERGNVDRAIFKPIASDATRVAGLLSGDVDLITPVPLQDVDRIKADPKLKVMESADLLTIHLGMNQFDEKLASTGLDKNPFKDKRVREAFAHAIDVEAIKSKIMRGYSVPNGLMVAEGVSGFQKELSARWSYDLEKAKSLMAEAGYPNGFTLSMDCSNDRYVKDEMICQSVAQMLAKIGVRVNLTAQTKSKFFERALGYKTDFYMLGWIPSTYDAHDAYYNVIASRKGSDQGKFNVAGYSNPKADEIIGKIHKEMDLTKRNQLLAEVMQIAKDDVAYIPLHQQKLIYGANKRILNMPIRSDDFVVLNDIIVE